MGEKSKKSEFKKSSFLKMKKPNFYLKMIFCKFIIEFNVHKCGTVLFFIETVPKAGLWILKSTYSYMYSCRGRQGMGGGGAYGSSTFRDKTP